MKKIVSRLCVLALGVVAVLTLSGCLTPPHGGGGGGRGGGKKGGGGGHGGPGGGGPGGGGPRSFEVEGGFDYSGEWDASQEAPLEEF